MDLPCLVGSSPAFPPRLRDIPEPPPRLWIRGRPEALARTAVAIVGSRRASPTSLDIARRLARDLAGAGLAIVSGLARGCDAAAHQGALDAGGCTVAVLGSGIDVLYPPEHAGLAEAIAATGAIVSEFPPGMPPLPNNFRQRNRLISGLAHGVIVIEANEKSGSLITAGFALAQGREVMVVPGTVVAGRNRGGHQLIRDGAALIETAEDVLAVLVAAVPPLGGQRERAALCAADGRAPLRGEAAAPPAERREASSAAEGRAPDDPVWAALDPVDGQDLDALTARTGLSGPAVLVRLADLELGGLAVRRPGGRFVRSAGMV